MSAGPEGNPTLGGAPPDPTDTDAESSSGMEDLGVAQEELQGAEQVVQSGGHGREYFVDASRKVGKATITLVGHRSARVAKVQVNPDGKHVVIEQRSLET